MLDRDAHWMRRALAEAARGLGAVEPNPMVGAVVVAGGQVVGIGHHAVFGGPHAEVVALAAAGERARGATVYVTLEPCCHVGKTPPCVDALLAAGVSRVVAAMRDPFPRVDGRGFDRLREAGVEVLAGVEAEAARRLNAPYLKRLATGTPYVLAKWAMTLDGRTATASGDSRWISGERSRALVHQTRGRVDAVLVGVGTALADDPLLTARPPGPRVAVRVVLDSSGRLPPGSRLVETAREFPTLIATTGRAPADRRASLEAAGVEVLAFDGDGPVPIDRLLAELGRRGMTNVLVEGGGRTLGAFLDAGQVDEVEVFVAPIIEGGEHHFTPARGRGVDLMMHARRLERVEVATSGVDAHIRGTLPTPWRAAAEA